MEISLQAPVVFYLGSIPVTSTIIAAWLAIAVLIVVSFMATHNMKLIPGKLPNFIEFAIEGLLGPCEQFAGARGRAFLPIVATLFFFIVVANWMGILPLYADYDWVHHVDWTADHTGPLRSANSDLNITAAMAMIVFVWVHSTFIRVNGLWAWIKHLTWGPPPVLELISEIARPVSLALRLFGNILAGEVLLLVMNSLVPYGIPIVFMAFELMVGIIQALIFAMLTLAFLAMATTGHGEEEHHGASH